MANEVENDDDVPTLSADTFNALKEFYNEQEERELLRSQAVSGNEAQNTGAPDMAEFGEDWQLSQFWYSDETSLALAKEIVQKTPENGLIACISAPSLDCALRKYQAQNPEIKRTVRLFEYDKRFAKFGEDFVFYDYK